MSCDVGKATEGLENELWRRWSDGKVGEWAELIVIVKAELIQQPFRHFTYVTAHSPTFPSLYLRHSSFSNPSIASPTSQFILQPFFCFSYVTSSSQDSPGEPPMTSCTNLATTRSSICQSSEPPFILFHEPAVRPCRPGVPNLFITADIERSDRPPICFTIICVGKQYSLFKARLYKAFELRLTIKNGCQFSWT